MNANGFEKLHGIDEMDEKQVLTLCRTAEWLTRQKLSGTIELYRPVKVQTGRTPRQTGARRIRRTNVMKRIGILGAGTWGMALARMLTVSGNDVLVWSAIEKEIDSLSTTRKHPNLPQMKIPDERRFTKSIEEVCKDKDILLFAVPSVFVRSTAAKARPYVADGQIIVDVAKGIEPYTTEGFDSKNWVLLDYSNVIVHVFVPNTRTYYDLEHLWADGEPIDISEYLTPDSTLE